MSKHRIEGMTISNRKPHSILAIGISFLVGSTLAFLLTETRNPEPHLQKGYFLESVLRKIQSEYVDEVNDEKLEDIFRDGLNLMVNQLDRNSRYITPKEVRRFEDDTHGTYSGIGIVIANGEENEYPVISTVVARGPAHRAGVLDGDTIIKIDSHDMLSKQSADVTKHIRGPMGSIVQMTVRDQQGQLKELSIQRGIVEKTSIGAVRLYSSQFDKASTEPPVGYIRLIQFQDGSFADLFTSLSHLVEAGARSLILDLRANVGGDLHEAVKIANLFLEEGIIVSTRGQSDRGKSQIFRVEKAGEFNKIRMCVLIDGGSASASEIVSAALRDHNKAILLGANSYGKWTVQTIFRLGKSGYDGRLKITTQRYYPPIGKGIARSAEDKNINGVGRRQGLIPDIACMDEENVSVELLRAWGQERLKRLSKPFAVDTREHPWTSAVEVLKPIEEIDPTLKRAVLLLANQAEFVQELAKQSERWSSNKDQKLEQMAKEGEAARPNKSPAPK